ncbi:hypothetical protein KFU94_25215 [Chloroflexi bacterium TSY]|nr:hypothetical protein [Chloroflexi bacterium TSY]
MRDYVNSGWARADIKEYSNAYFETFHNEQQLPYLRIPGAAEYLQILDQHIFTAISGEVSARDALEAAAQEFDQLTQKLGRQKQLESYRALLGIKED